MSGNNLGWLRTPAGLHFHTDPGRGACGADVGTSTRGGNGAVKDACQKCRAWVLTHRPWGLDRCPFCGSILYQTYPGFPHHMLAPRHAVREKDAASLTKARCCGWSLGAQGKEDHQEDMPGPKERRHASS